MLYIYVLKSNLLLLWILLQKCCCAYGNHIVPDTCNYRNNNTVWRGYWTCQLAVFIREKGEITFHCRPGTSLHYGLLEDGLGAGNGHHRHVNWTGRERKSMLQLMSVTLSYSHFLCCQLQFSHLNF